MKYEEAIRESLKQVVFPKIDKDGNEIGGSNYIYPFPFTYFAMSIAALQVALAEQILKSDYPNTTKYDGKGIENVKPEHIIRLMCNSELSLRGTAYFQNMYRFFSWLFQEEIPEESSTEGPQWFTVEQLQKKWNEFAETQN